MTILTSRTRQGEKSTERREHLTTGEQFPSDAVCRKLSGNEIRGDNRILNGVVDADASVREWD
jgi:hypothetical protein